MLSLHHLSIFHAVAGTGSVSAGAERLMISQPGVSKQIRLMERQLKTRLFDRHAKGVMLTVTGKLLADYTNRIFGLLDEAEQALGDLSDLKRGSLSIGAGPTVGVYLLPAAMVRFRREHPNVLLKAETESPELLRQRLLDGLIELAVSESLMPSPHLMSKVLLHDMLVPVVGKSHRLASSRSVLPEMFCSQPFITRQVNSDTGSLVEQTLGARGLKIVPILTVSSTEAIKQAVIAGLGVGIVSRMAIQTEIAAGLLVELNVKGLRIRHPIYVIWRKGRSESKLASRFLAMLKGCKS